MKKYFAVVYYLSLVVLGWVAFHPTKNTLGLLFVLLIVMSEIREYYTKKRIDTLSGILISTLEKLGEINKKKESDLEELLNTVNGLSEILSKAIDRKSGKETTNVSLQ